MKTIVQNLAVEYRDEGTGPVMLMLHGWKDSLHTFDALSTELAKTHRIIRLDLPGFGESDMPKGTWRLEEYVQFVRDFIAKLDLTVDTLVGHSFGGRVIIKGVGSGVLKPERIVLISAAGLAKRRTLRNQLLSLVAKAGKIATSIPPFTIWQKELRRRLYAAIGSDYFAAGELKDTFVAVVSEDLSGYASKITIPALIIWGNRDDTTPVEQAERIHALVQGSQLQVLGGAGHFVHRERSGDIIRLIQTFA